MTVQRIMIVPVDSPESYTIDVGFVVFELVMLLSPPTVDKENEFRFILPTEPDVSKLFSEFYAVTDYVVPGLLYEVAIILTVTEPDTIELTTTSLTLTPRAVVTCLRKVK